MTRESLPRLDVISVGEIGPAAIESIEQYFAVSTTAVETEGSLPEHLDWSDFAGPVNRFIDEVSGWVLLLREGERVPPILAAEIARLAIEKPVAWAFRVPVSIQYAGGPLYRGAGRSGGEIRLFHSRRCRFLPKGSGRELQSRGTVIRISAPLERVLFSSRAEHLAALDEAGVPHSLPRRISIFLARLWRDRRQLTRRTLRYHWIEAGSDRGRVSGEF